MHWAKLMGLKTMGRGVRGMWRGYYLIGRGRCFRVSLHGELEVSCPISEFDRWANSRVASYRVLPKTEAEFRQIIGLLRGLAAAHEAEEELEAAFSSQ
jgi:hypothetical protein